MSNFHKKYMRCFSKFVKNLEHEKIAKLESHEHPLFDFRTHHPQITYASAVFRPYNPKVLERFIDYANSRLNSQNILVTIDSTKEGESYRLTLKPHKNIPRTQHQNELPEERETERVMCSLSTILENFQKKEGH